ncbi:MAG: hypothetical protein AB4058_12010 [Microcystaceae cyanobacterium]
MNDQQLSHLHQKIHQGVQKATAEAIEKHRKLGESIAVWQEGEVVILPPEKIPTLETKNEE